VIPFLFVFSGTLLLKGNPVFIVTDFVTAIAGVWLISAAVMGYSVRPLRWIDRCAYLIAGVCLMMPVDAIPNARWLNVLRGLFARAVFVWDRVPPPRPARAAPAPGPPAPGPPAPAPAPVGAAPVGAAPATPQSAAEQRAMLDRLGIRGSGEAE